MKLVKICICVGATCLLVACMLPQKTVTDEVALAEVTAKDAGGYYYYAESRLKRRHGQLDEAVALLKEAIVRDEDSMFLKRELVRLYIHQNDYKAALAIAQDIIQNHPEHVPSLVMLGGIHAALNQHTDAIEAYKEALKLDPKSENTYFLLGSAYITIKQPEKAMQLYQDLIQIDPQSFAGHFYLGSLNATLKYYDKAEAALLKAIELIQSGIETLLRNGPITIENSVIKDVVIALLDGAPVLVVPCGNTGDNTVLQNEDCFVDDFVDRFVAQILESFAHRRDESTGALGNLELDIRAGQVLKEHNSQVIVG